MHLIHGHKKHQSRVGTSEVVISPPIVGDNSRDGLKSSKPMKSRIKSFWRRHSSGKTLADSNNRQAAPDQPVSVSLPTSPLSRSSAEESPLDGILTPSDITSLTFFPSDSVSEVVSAADSALTTATARSSFRSSGGKSVSSSLKQAMLIAGGLVDISVVYSPSDARHAETSKYQRPSLTSALPRIPEHVAAGGYTAAQLERLTAAVPRRQNAPANRNEYFSAPPGIYWPDLGFSTIPEAGTYDRVNVETSAVAPCPLTVSSPPHRVASPKLAVTGKEEQAYFYRLPRFSLLSRSCRQSSDRRLLSSVDSAPKSASPPPRVSTTLSRYSSSPGPTSNSPIALLHRPLPPPPTSEAEVSVPCALNTAAVPVDFPSDCGSQVWQAVPMLNSQCDFEVVDTIVYSNVRVPVLRVASPPTVTADSSTFSGGSASCMNQTDEAAKPQPPPPSHSPSCQDRPIPQRRHISPVDRRKLSPRSRTAQNMAAAANGHNYTNCPQGNTIISHHPASPFAPLPRVSPGGQTSPPAVSSRVDTCCQHQSQGQRCCCCCCSELLLSTTVGLRSRSPTEPCSCTQRARGQIHASSPIFQPSSRKNNADQDDDVGANSRTNPIASAHSLRTVLPTNRQESVTGPRKDISATYEEAWDLKMARRLPGMDVSRLASVSPAAAAAKIPGGVRSMASLEAATEARKSLSPAPAQFTAGGDVFRASERLNRHSGRLLAGDAVAYQPQDDSVVGSVAARTSSSRSSFCCSHSPSPLLPMLTSTEEITVVPRRVNRSERQCNHRTASTDASFERDITPTHFHRKHSADVKLSFSTNLDQEAEGSPGNGLTPTENIARRLPPEGQNLPRRADRPLSSPGDMPESQASPHRLDSVMPDTDSPLPAEPPLSADATSGLTSVASVEAQPPSSQLRIRSPRGNHNLLASGVLSHPADATLVVSLSSQQSPAAPASVQANQGAPEAAEEAGVETCDSNAVLPPMSRLLTDFDSLSTDSYEEAWDLRHGRVISQLTRTRFIDPEEVLSEVVNSGRQGIGFLGKGGSNRQQQQQSETSDQMLYPKSSLNNVVSAGDCAVLAALSPPISCQSSLVCQRNAPAYPSTPPELKPLHEQTWFHPSLSRSDAETCLRSEPDGSFLVRNSETNKNDFSLTIKHNGFLHMKISRNIHGKFILGEYSQPYASIPEMISHYERTRVPVRGADSVVLCHPR